MTSTIDRFVFFFLHLIESLTSFRLPEKTSLIIAPLLPFCAFIIGLYFTYNSTLLFVLVIPLILTFILSVGSYDFFKGRNIFIISKSLRILRLSIKDYNPNIDVLQIVLERKCLEIKLIKEETIDIQLETISFSEVQNKMITKAFNILTKEIISDGNTLKGFIEAIKYSDLKEVEQIKLELESKHCAVFLRTFFIPYVMILTNRELTLAEASTLFKYRKKNSYRPVIADSISKKPRQLSTQYQRITYKTLLDELKKVS